MTYRPPTAVLALIDAITVRRFLDKVRREDEEARARRQSGTRAADRPDERPRDTP